jgi:HAE1 family hydrophobic/amphiphilic exporter-1
MNLPPDKVVADINSGYDSSRGRRGRGRGPESPLSSTSLLAALLLITIVMAFLFESITRPLVVLLACIPGAVAGAFWALIMTDTMFDALCGLGEVVLLGVAVNNGIVFVDLINRLRAEGVALNSAIRQAGEQRLRPMLMTSLTTIAGLVPMAVSTSAFFDMPYYPLARTILGGMIVSTLVTLIAVPVWYGVIENSRDYVGTVFGALLRRRK